MSVSTELYLCKLIIFFAIFVAASDADRCRSEGKITGI